MNTLTAKFEQIKWYCKAIDDADYACYKLYPPANAEDIAKWEADNSARLPEGFKSWLLLSNGFEMSSAADLLPLENICAYPFEDHRGLYIVGHYIGDGSMLVSDKDGRFFELDHAFGLKEMTFEQFLDDWIMCCLKDNMLEIEEMNKEQ
ncbi:MAG: SMI1/KNR4 family protein [Oscillospiraceae bacterium]|nr:SMI1/KNR4 family protein [Oscillospiraceae bacterium]